jgi:hypothetical protein
MKREIAATKRRHHERSFKADLILQSLVPGASVSADLPHRLHQPPRRIDLNAENG